MILEKRFIYYPVRYPVGEWDAPSRGPLPVEDVWLTTEDGVRLHGWLATGPGARTTWLYFHGNAGNLSHRYDWLCHLASLPARVLLVDYRGYGRSQGSPDEAGLYRDGEAAYRYLREDLAVPPERLFLYGKSLGGAVACHLAAGFPCAGLVLQSTFTSAVDMARRLLPMIPAGLIRHRFDTRARIAQVRAPKLILHSRQDEIIPWTMAQELHDAAPEPKRLVLLTGPGHNEMILQERDALMAEFRRFVDSAIGSTGTSPGRPR